VIFSLSDTCPDSLGAGGEGRGEEAVVTLWPLGSWGGIKGEGPALARHKLSKINPGLDSTLAYLAHSG